MSRTGIFWVTFRSSDIGQAKQFMESLKGDNTIDVLGLSRSMEVVSDILFPATSTLHKKIRYQIFIPAIILTIYNSKKRINPEEKLRELEFQLQKTLLDSGEEYNVFGSSRGEALKYWPSMIYWASLNMLKLWGDEYLGRNELLELIEGHHNLKTFNDEKELEEETWELTPTEGLSDLCKRLFTNGKMSKKLTFRLEREEAKFLKNRFLHLFPNSLTTYILKNGNVHQCRDGLFDLRCPRHPGLNNLLKQAEIFSRVAMGATYAYRWALCCAKGLKDGEDRNLEHFQKWIKRNREKVYDWRYDALVNASMRFDKNIGDDVEAKFIGDFIRISCGAGVLEKKLETLDGVMRKREEQIKGKNRSHFNNPDLQITQNTLGGGEYDDYLFSYRWAQGYSNLKDIFTGLKRR